MDLRTSPASHVEAANHDADAVWDIVEGAPDLDVSAVPTTEQVEGWYQDGLISEKDGFFLLTGRTI